MKNIRFILCLFWVVISANNGLAQTCPKVIFFEDQVDSSECNNTGLVTISLGICPNTISGIVELDHVVWNMGDGITITTNSLQITHTYSSSAVFNITAWAHFNINGVPCSTQVLSTAVGDVTLENLCNSSITSTVYHMPVQLLSADLYTNPLNTTPLYPTTAISILLGYQGAGLVNGDIGYELFIDGVSVGSGPSLASIGTFPVVKTAAYYPEGQHVAEILLKNKYNFYCPVTATTIFEVLPPPDSIANCSDCFTFRPDRTKRYWLSAWVKEEVASQVKTYTNTSVKLTFNGSGAGVTTLSPTGEIIDGWQRIAGEFTVPANTTSIDIKLDNVGSVAAYFDDIRVHPFNASMKSYVNDPETFWLTAELDDNNYATFYEYDKEGKLIRIKKETAKGIMTIQESRTSNPKTN
jgi:hypothetical protein